MFKFHSLSKVMTVSCVLVLLSGCVVAIGDKTHTAADSGWQRQQASQRQAISQLALGVSSEQVRQQLGQPDFTELFTQGEQQVLVLFYRTQQQKSTDKISKEQCTPLIFKDNQLTGWGDKAYQYL